VNRALPALVLVVALSAPGCAKQCKLTLDSAITEDVTLTTVQVRHEGTTIWGGENLLERPLEPGTTRILRLPQSAPWSLDLRAADSVRSWSRLDALVCDVPDEQLTLTLTDADRDQPCTWTLQNETGGDLDRALLRPEGFAPWTRDLLDGALLSGEATTFVVDDEAHRWELQARAGDDTWTVTDLGRCDAGAEQTITLTTADGS